MRKKLSRGQFFKTCLALIAYLVYGMRRPQQGLADNKTSDGRPKKNTRGAYDIVEAKGDDPYRVTVKAIEAMGGIDRFVKKGDTVLVKPNIGWDRSPEQAATTNPKVVAAIVELCFNAGARRVNVFDVTCNDARRCYDNSGIMQAAVAKGANVFFPDDWNTFEARLPYDSPLQGWPILRDALECDTFINVPILKHHSISKLTLSMKNLMGICGGNRGMMHRDIGTYLVDLTDFINPELTIIDAYRVLRRNGPTGGNLADVEERKTVIAATDPTLADTYAAKLFGIDPFDIPNIRVARDRKFGSVDIASASVSTIEV